MSQNILSPFTLPSGAVLSNRIAKAALTERLAKSNHLPNELHQRLYRHWASHGASLLLTGNILVDKRYLESTGNIVIQHDTEKEAFRRWVGDVVSYDIHFWAQLSHAGRQSNRFASWRPVSASDVQLEKMMLFGKPIPLTESGIEEVIARFVHAARFSKEVGFTGVQFHAAHGYLISQFLSPRTNKRQDQWGGSIENRARILLEIVVRTRKLLGSSFPISVKLNSADFLRGGFDVEDATYVILELEKRGIDLLEISGGTYERSAMMGVGMKESTRSREAYFLDFAKQLRSKSEIALMVTGGFRTLSVCNEALNQDELDVIGFGRPFLQDDHFPQGFIDGTLDRVIEPKINILDSNNADAAEAGYYDIQLDRLAHGLPLATHISGLRSALRIPLHELKRGIRNRFMR